MVTGKAGDKSVLERLLEIPNGANALVTRGGVYDSQLNVWIADEFAATVAANSSATRGFLDALAGVAIAAGQLHTQQLRDAKAGRVWPLEWLNRDSGADVIAFCQAHEEAASPYSVIDLAQKRAVPYTHHYRDELVGVNDALANLLAVGGQDAEPLLPYVKALRQAFQDDATRSSDLAAMGAADVAWLEIGDDARWLLLCEFTETYADPLKHHVSHDPAVNAWANQVAEANGLGPWRTFFEFRLLEMMDNLVTSREIEAIRATIRQLYCDASDSVPSSRARTEFRRALINAGHGANPPKSAKNYPNQNWIRAEVGYRNVIFANQAQEKVRAENVPALCAAFDTSWSRDRQLVDRLLRATALSIVAHEESHPWVVFSGVSWLEELKCNVLGLNALHHADLIREDVAAMVLGLVASALNAHRQQPKLVARGETQLQDYYIGDVIFVSFLADGGYFAYDAEGMAVDVRGELAAPLIAKFAERILAIKRGDTTPGELYAEFYRDAAVFQRFRGLVLE